VKDRIELAHYDPSPEPALSETKGLRMTGKTRRSFALGNISCVRIYENMG